MRKRPELAEGLTSREPRKGASDSIASRVAKAGPVGPEGEGGGKGPDEEFRCGCGSLMARRRGEIIELKCRRCRRCHHLRFLPGGEVVVSEAPPSTVTEEGHDPEQR
jgi:hypothetical protein